MFKFYGKDKKKNYFEGWYFKIVSKDCAIAFIPSMNIDCKGNKSAYIQVITNKGSYYFRFSYDEFIFDQKNSKLRIGKNVFSKKGMIINLKNDEISLKGKIRFYFMIPLRYDIMGIFSCITLMECRHGIISLWHRLSGELIIRYNNCRRITFEGGTGYIETDRGSSFPKSYLWTQCNFFNDSYNSRKCSIVAAAADIPFAGFHFNGCICIIYFRGKEYRIATYLGARVIERNKESITLAQGKYLFSASLLAENPHKLFAPVSGEMLDIVHESVACRVRYRFYVCKQIIFDYTSDYAGFECRLSAKSS